MPWCPDLSGWTEYPDWSSFTWARALGLTPSSQNLPPHESQCPLGWGLMQKSIILGAVASLCYNTDKNPSDLATEIWGCRGIRISYKSVHTLGPEPAALSAPDRENEHR